MNAKNDSPHKEESALVSLKEFFIEKLNALEKTTELSRSALEKNVETARSALEKNTETARSALEKNTELARSSLEKNNEVSRIALEKRLDTMNEFRDAIKDQSNSFLTRVEMALIIEKIEADIRVLRESKATHEGGYSALSVGVALIVAVVSAVASMMALRR